MIIIDFDTFERDDTIDFNTVTTLQSLPLLTLSMEDKLRLDEIRAKVASSIISNFIEELDIASDTLEAMPSQPQAVTEQCLWYILQHQISNFVLSIRGAQDRSQEFAIETYDILDFEPSLSSFVQEHKQRIAEVLEEITYLFNDFLEDKVSTVLDFSSCVMYRDATFPCLEWSDGELNLEETDDQTLSGYLLEID